MILSNEKSRCFSPLWPALWVSSGSRGLLSKKGGFSNNSSDHILKQQLPKEAPSLFVFLFKSDETFSGSLPNNLPFASQRKFNNSFTELSYAHYVQ